VTDPCLTDLDSFRMSARAIVRLAALMTEADYPFYEPLDSHDQVTKYGCPNTATRFRNFRVV